MVVTFNGRNGRNVVTFHCMVVTFNSPFKSSSYHNESPELKVKPTRVVVSKFRKGRKRRSRGYYSSSLAQKRINFVGALPCESTQHNQGNAAVDVVGVNASKFELPNVSISYCPDLVSRKNDKNLCMKFASAIWRLLPSKDSDIVDLATIVDRDHKLTWLDLHTLNPTPSPSIFSAINSHCGNSGKGWLSKYVVDAYLSVLVHLANKQKGQCFGSLDCDQSSMIIDGKSIKNKFVFASKILESERKELRPVIYLPVLLNKHFVLFWFCKERNCVTLIDSSTMGKNGIASSSLRIVAEFLQNFIDTNEKIVVEESTFIEQPDSNSCGVCVCVAAKMIYESICCKKNATKFTASNINDFRYSIMWDLYANASECDPSLNEVGKAALGESAVFGLPNIGNTCWFNSTIQSIVAVSRKISPAETKKSNEQLRESDLKSFLIRMINGNIDYERALKKAILCVCKTCKFQFGNQQDPEEFYSQSSLTSILESIGISCALKCQTAYRCQSCNAISHDQLLEQTDLILLVSSQSSSCSSLQDIINGFCDGIDLSRECKDCALTGIHTSKVVFQRLPSLLVICLGRVIHGHEILKSSSAISPLFTLTLNNAQNYTCSTYHLTSVLVHLGTDHDSGHYVCYNFISKNRLQVFDDSKSYFQSYDEVKNIIETNGYLFFYARTAVSEVSCDFSSDSDGSDARQLWLPKRCVKRRRPLNLVTAPAPEIKVFYETRLAQYEPQYVCSDKFGTIWETLNKEKITFIISNLVEVMGTPLSKAKSEQRFHRHFLYLNSRIKNLKKYNDLFDIPTNNVSTDFAVDLGSFVRKVLCHSVFKDRIVGEGSSRNFVSQKIGVGSLRFKDSFVDGKSDIAKNLQLGYQNCCNDYVKLVLDYEALLYYAMVEYKLEYEVAAMFFKLNKSQLRDHTYSLTL